MYPDYSQMPPMGQSGMMGAPGLPLGGAIPNQQPNPDGTLPQGKTAMNPGANPTSPGPALPNPSSMAPGQPGSTQQGPPAPAPSMASNMMGPVGSPSPASSPAVPTPQVADNKTPGSVQSGQQGALIKAIPSKGKTSTGQDSGSLNDIAMQIMSEGMMGGSNSMMGGMGM